MQFPWTFQRYIFREMSKTFLLTALALTAVLGLGGGVLNMMKLGGVTPGQLTRLMALVLPLAAALTLPVAALFSATSTYGRLSGDNEFVACRSSGINMHVLFLPTVVLSFLAASVCFGFTNFVIPGMVRNLNEFVGSDFGALIRQRLNRPRGITLGGKYRIYADQCIADPSNPDRIALRGVAFVEVDNAEWVRHGTFRELRLTFHRSETPVRVSALALGVSWYDRKLGHFVENEKQTITSNEIPSLVPRKIKFLNLNELFYYLANPTQWGEVRRIMQRLRTATGRTEVYQKNWNDWLDDKELTLSDEVSRYTVRSDTGVLLPRGGGIELTDVEIEESRRAGTDRQRWFTAERANVSVTRGETFSECNVKIELYDARISDGATTLERSKTVLGPVAIAPDLIARIDARSDAELLDPKTAVANDPLAQIREQVRNERAETLRRIVGVINERMAFSVSVFVLVILGAVLGIVFRGSHVMTAFGISFVPALFVIIAIVMGKQMSQNAGTHVFGLLVMWGGIAIVAGLDLWTLTRVLRR